MLNCLTLPELAELDGHLKALEPSTSPVRKYCKHTPHPRQAEFLGLNTLEALYGGAAGGGKSDALLMAALQHVDKPGYSALLLRRTYADLSLPGALMDRANQWWRGTDARWSEKSKTWTFPSGATITFGYLENANDQYRYQGSELQFIGFDEATQFGEAQYRYLLSRLRRLEGVNIPVRARCASNPGGLGHEWVKQRFVNPGSDERPFVPARLDDNPSLDATEYDRSLMQLDPVTRAQLREGDWNIALGTLFRREWFDVVDQAPPGLKWVRYWDLAASTRESADYTASAACGFGRDGKLYIRDMIRGRWEWPDARKIMLQTIMAEPATITAVEDAMHGLAALQDLRRLPQLMDRTIIRVRPDRDKLSRALPWAARAEQGGIRLVRGAWIEKFLDECCSFPEGEHDDQVDTISGGVRLFALTTPEAQEPTQEKDALWWPAPLRSTPLTPASDGLGDYETTWSRTGRENEGLYD